MASKANGPKIIPKTNHPGTLFPLRAAATAVTKPKANQAKIIPV